MPGSCSEQAKFTEAKVNVVYLARMEVTMDYKKAGVDIEAGYKAVSLMKEHIASTMRQKY